MSGRIFQLLFQIVAQLIQIHLLEQLLDGFGAHAGFKAVAAVTLHHFRVLVFGEKLALFQAAVLGIGDNVLGKVQHFFQTPGRQVQDLAHPGRNALEVPDMGHRGRQFDVAHPFPANLGPGDFHAALITNLAFVALALILSAVALPVLGRSEDALAEQAAFLRFQSPVVDGFRLGDLAVGPFPNLFRRCQTDFD